MIAKFLNANCACQTFDPDLLKSKLESDELLKGLYGQIIEGRPNLFSATTVFISPDQFEAMSSTVNAIEETARNPKFRSFVMGRSPSIAQLELGTKGVFMGYDFHLSDDSPKLIEVNTNAGGALLNLELAKAQQECCQELNVFFKHREELLSMDKLFYEMFMHEWELQRGQTKIGLIAIVDDSPEEQYLYPEFQLFQRLFAKFGTKESSLPLKTCTFETVIFGTIKRKSIWSITALLIFIWRKMHTHQSVPPMNKIPLY